MLFAQSKEDTIIIQKEGQSQHRPDSLQNITKVADYETRLKQLSEKILSLEKTIETDRIGYEQSKNIGWGLLGGALLMGYFFWKKNNQLLKVNNQRVLEEKKRLEDLLSNLLPAEVVRQLKKKQVAKSRQYKSVCVLFSDFKNFSQISKELSPEELVSELDYCFSSFDRIIEKHRLQKIKTIGDAYMCVGGLYTQGEGHVQRMILAALEIQQFLKDRKAKQPALGGYFFDARIGIHVGPVVAGVIGTKKIAFDVWGDTVNVAQQMEHHSEVGEVNISGATYKRVRNRFKCVQRGEIVAKNKKRYVMYFVRGINIL